MVAKPVSRAINLPDRFAASYAALGADVSRSLSLWLPILPPRHDSAQINTQPVSSLKNTHSLFNHRGLFYVKGPEVCTTFYSTKSVPSPTPQHCPQWSRGSGGAAQSGQGLCIAPPRGTKPCGAFQKVTSARTEQVWMEVVEDSMLGFLMRRN